MNSAVWNLAITGMVCACAGSALALDLAEPAVVIPPARMSIGLSYHVGGYTITNDKVPAILNRIMANASFAPLTFAEIGIDLGATQMEVAGLHTTSDTIGAFHGDYRFSGGGHLKLSTPFFFKNYMAIIGIGEVTYFSSQNGNSAEYSAIDGAGALGVQFRIPQFGFISGGAKLYLMDGNNKSYDGATHKFANVNNLRGWLAIDFVPDHKGDVKGKPYFSAECSVAPGVKFTDSVPLEEIAFSLSVGWISPRLYGEEPEEQP
jgi:hypothetical protein